MNILTTERPIYDLYNNSNLLGMYYYAFFVLSLFDQNFNFRIEN